MGFCRVAAGPDARRGGRVVGRDLLIYESAAVNINDVILSQAAALRKIAVADGYATDIGMAVIYPAQPADELLSASIYRAGEIGLSDAGMGAVRVTLTWAVIVVGEPADLDRLAIEAQGDIVRALNRCCEAATVARQSIPERALQSNAAIAPVVTTFIIQEPEL